MILKGFGGSKPRKIGRELRGFGGSKPRKIVGSQRSTGTAGVRGQQAPVEFVRMKTIGTRKIYAPAKMRRTVSAWWEAQAITRAAKSDPHSFTSLSPSPQRKK